MTTLEWYSDESLPTTYSEMFAFGILHVMTRSSGGLADAVVQLYVAMVPIVSLPGP